MSGLHSLHVDPTLHERHALHAPDRTWVDMNCYVDLWIELLARLGLPPEPAGVVALSADALPKQWGFYKYQVDDLRLLYGIHVAELNVWRSVEDHVLEVMAVGDLVAIECDGWYLPDTGGAFYRTEHEKTTIVPLDLDPQGRSMRYLHNSGHFTLYGADYDGVLAANGAPTMVPHPYVEHIRLASWAHHRHEVLERLPESALALARDHLERAPLDNPAGRLAAGIRAELPQLGALGMDHFHRYSFATTRQLGLTAQNAADGMRWLAANGDLSDAARNHLDASALHFDGVSVDAKKVQFGLARVASGRGRDLDPLLESFTAGWGRAMESARAGLR